MATLQDAVKGVMDLVAEVSGIRDAPEYPTDSIKIYPFAVGYARTGRFEFGVQGEMKGMHDIVVEVHCARAHLRSAVEAAMDFSDAVPAAIMADQTLGGNVDTFEMVTYEFGALDYGGQQTIGFRFVVRNVKLRADL